MSYQKQIMHDESKRTTQHQDVKHGIVQHIFTFSTHPHIVYTTTAVLFIGLALIGNSMR